MAHNLATTNGRTAMMYAGEVPWHGLGILAQTGIRNDQQIRGCLLDRPCCLLDNPPLFESAGSGSILFIGNSEEDNSGNAKIENMAGFLTGLVDGEIEDSRHGADFSADMAARNHEQRVDEIPPVKACFTHQGA